MGRSLRLEDGEAFGFRISPFQGAAAASPDRPTRVLLGLIPALIAFLEDAGAEGSQSASELRSPNSFEDFDELLEQLATVPSGRPGKPATGDRHRLRQRVGSNPAAHNRALLGDRGPKDEGERAAE